MVAPTDWRYAGESVLRAAQNATWAARVRLHTALQETSHQRTISALRTSIRSSLRPCRRALKLARLPEIARSAHLSTPILGHSTPIGSDLCANVIIERTQLRIASLTSGGPPASAWPPSPCWRSVLKAVPRSPASSTASATPVPVPQRQGTRDCAEHAVPGRGCPSVEPSEH